MDKLALSKYLGALFLFGLNGVVASKITIPSYDIVFFRTLIGSVFLIITYLLIEKRFTFHHHRRELGFISLSGIAMGLSWMFLFEGYKQIGVGISSLLYYCGPVIVMMLSPYIFKEQLTKPKIIGCSIVLLGVVFLNGYIGTDRLNPFGIFCGVLSAIMLFLMITFNKMSKHITGMENSVIQLTVSFITVCIFVGIKEQFNFEVPSDNWLWIVILGVVNTGFCCYLYFSPLSKLPVQTVAICGYLEPLSAVVFATVLLHEHMSLLQSIGAFAIIAGAMIGELVKTKHK